MTSYKLDSNKNSEKNINPNLKLYKIINALEYKTDVDTVVMIAIT